MDSRTLTTTGIVLKRKNIGETDRLVSLLTADYGKIMVVAKGIRKLNSSKGAYLEPGNFVKAFLINTKSMPLLTQAMLLEDCGSMEQSLPNLRALSQLLEIFEKLFVEEKIEPHTYALVLKLRKQIITNQVSPKHMRALLGQLINSLGYQHPQESKYDTISDYISALTDKPMNSYEFLMVK